MDTSVMPIESHSLIGHCHHTIPGGSPVADPIRPITMPDVMDELARVRGTTERLGRVLERVMESRKTIMDAIPEIRSRKNNAEE